MLIIALNQSLNEPLTQCTSGFLESCFLGCGRLCVTRALGEVRHKSLADSLGDSRRTPNRKQHQINAAAAKGAVAT
jgi:hypothetical protein